VAIADLQKTEVCSRWQRVSGLSDLGKGFGHEDAAADRPKQAGAGPRHALEKAATIDPVMFVIVRNVIGHNIYFLKVWSCLVIVFHLCLLISGDFIPSFAFVLVFPARVFRNGSYLLKRKSRLEPATTAEFFWFHSPCRG
jgi:hypothetical protein